jgi:hypothetical protein
MQSDDEVSWYRYRRTPLTALAGPLIVVWLGVRIALQHPAVHDGVKLWLVVLPLPFFLWFILRVVRHLRTMDELERRIQLEALALGFLLTVAMLMTVGLLQVAGISPEGGWSLSAMLIYAGGTYLIGRAIARRRYA